MDLQLFQADRERLREVPCSAPIFIVPVNDQIVLISNHLIILITNNSYYSESTRYKSGNVLVLERYQECVYFPCDKQDIHFRYQRSYQSN